MGVTTKHEKSLYCTLGDCSLLNSFLPSVSSIVFDSGSLAFGEVMENFAELIQRLLEIQSGGRERSPELILEDERLMDGLQKRNLAGKSTQGLLRAENNSGD